MYSVMSMTMHGGTFNYRVTPSHLHKIISYFRQCILSFRFNCESGHWDDVEVRWYWNKSLQLDALPLSQRFLSVSTLD